MPVLSSAETVSCGAYKARVLDAGRPHVVVDVREAHQFAIASLPGAISIPLKNLESRIPEVQVRSRAARGEMLSNTVGSLLRSCDVSKVSRAKLVEATGSSREKSNRYFTTVLLTCCTRFACSTPALLDHIQA